IRTSARPSTPSGSGSRPSRMQSEKYSSWRELIAFRKAAFLCLALDGQLILQRRSQIICWLQTQRPFGTDDLIRRHIVCSEAAGERRQPVARELHDGAGHFFDLMESLAGIAHANGTDFEWFVLEQIARGVDAVDADVVQGSAAKIGTQPNIALLHLHG